MNESDAKEGVAFPLHWTAHRAIENPARSAIVIAIIILFAFFAAIFMDSLMWGIICVLVLFLGLIRYFAPTQYAADSTGISEKFLGTGRTASWRMFRRAVVVQNDVLLSPYAKKTFLDRFRAWQVHAPNEEVAQLIAKIVKEKAGTSNS